MSAEAVIPQKQSFRKRINASREVGHACGHSHSQLLIDYVWEQRAKSVACYISFGDEPSTNIFLRHCQYEERIDLYVPRVQGEDLEWVLFSEDQARHPLGMNEPNGEAVPLTEVDLMVIPALAADRQGHRLGRGRGFYDRALKQIFAKKVIVLVHDDEFLDEIPFEAHDVLVQVVCTCNEIVTV